MCPGELSNTTASNVTTSLGNAVNRADKHVAGMRLSRYASIRVAPVWSCVLKEALIVGHL